MIRKMLSAMLCVALLLTGCFAAWPGLYRRSELRVNASRQWNDVRIWVSAERYDYAAEDGGRYLNAMRWDFRFLYDYGYSLHKTGDYRRSNEILALGMQISSDPMFWNITGRNCEALGDFEAAELWIIPVKTAPTSTPRRGLRKDTSR